MKVKTLIVLGMATATLWTSCSKENPAEQLPQEILLNSNIELRTRGIQETQIVTDERLSLFITKAAGEALYNNVILTANGSGSFTHTPLFYPMDRSAVNFYAVHPYDASQTTLGTMPFSVQANQTTHAGYLSSDLLYASKENVEETTNAVRLVFKHKLSKLEFTIKQGDGSDHLTGLSALKVIGLKPTTTLNLQTGALGTASGTATTIQTNGVSSTDASEATGISAVVVPQTLPSGTRFLQITIGDVEYYYTTVAELAFAESKKYIFELTIKQGGITLDSVIEEWDEGDTIAGEGQAD